MRSHTVLVMLAVLLSTSAADPVAGSEPVGDIGPEVTWEILVPFDDLNVLLQHAPRRVLLSRAEYDELLRKARQTPEAAPPRAAVAVSADYVVSLECERATVVGALVVEVLQEGLHTLDLDLADVGLRRATLDGRGAALGRNAAGGLTLFVEGVGRHQLMLELVAGVETTAARQKLDLRLPITAATRMRLSVPGDVEIKAGADVVSRVFDEAAQATRFELLPRPGPMSLQMTLNNRLLQTRRVVVARSVVVDEITSAYERLHATFSMEILHRPVDRFRFALPDGFELTDVRTPLLLQWSIDGGGTQPALEVQLREPTTETTVIALSATRPASAARLETWHLPRFVPLDAMREMAVVGLLLEERLKLQSLDSQRLIPIDARTLTAALPATVFEAGPGAPRVRAGGGVLRADGPRRLRHQRLDRRAGRSSAGHNEFCG